MRRASSHGLAPAVHAIGDQANTIALDAFADVGCAGRIEHAQLLSPSDVPRFAELGVVAAVQPAHQPDDRDVADRHWFGRTSRAFPYRSLLDSAPAWRSARTRRSRRWTRGTAIASAVGRTDDDRPPWHPEQAIPLPDALAAASGGRRGVAVGDVADLIVTAADPLTLSPSDLRALPVTATILAGHVTHLT